MQDRKAAAVARTIAGLPVQKGKIIQEAGVQKLCVVCRDELQEDTTAVNNCKNCHKRCHQDCMRRCTKEMCGWWFCVYCCDEHEEQPVHKQTSTGALVWVSTTEKAQEKVMAENPDPEVQKVLKKSAVSTSELETLAKQKTREGVLQRTVRFVAGGSLVRVAGSTEATPEQKELAKEKLALLRQRVASIQEFKKQESEHGLGIQNVRTKSQWFIRQVEAIRAGKSQDTVWNLLRKERLKRIRRIKKEAKEAATVIGTVVLEEKAGDDLQWPPGTWRCECGQANMRKEVECNGTKQGVRCKGTFDTTFEDWVKPPEPEYADYPMEYTDRGSQKHHSGPRTKEQKARSKQNKRNNIKQQWEDRVAEYHWVCSKCEKRGKETKVYLESFRCHVCNYAPEYWDQVETHGDYEEMLDRRKAADEAEAKKRKPAEEENQETKKAKLVVPDTKSGKEPLSKMKQSNRNRAGQKVQAQRAAQGSDWDNPGKMYLGPVNPEKGKKLAAQQQWQQWQRQQQGGNWQPRHGWAGSSSETAGPAHGRPGSSADAAGKGRNVKRTKVSEPPAKEEPKVTDKAGPNQVRRWGN